MGRSEWVSGLVANAFPMGAWIRVDDGRTMLLPAGEIGSGSRCDEAFSVGDEVSVRIMKEEPSGWMCSMRHDDSHRRLIDPAWQRCPEHLGRGTWSLLRRIQRHPPRSSVDPILWTYLSLFRMGVEQRAVLEAWAAHHVRNLRVGRCFIMDDRYRFAALHPKIQARTESGLDRCGQRMDGFLVIGTYPGSGVDLALYFLLGPEPEMYAEPIFLFGTDVGVQARSLESWLSSQFRDQREARRRHQVLVPVPA